ncbi:MAG: CocE/NonD family hydrolase [Pseudomonadota bacterium]
MVNLIATTPEAARSAVSMPNDVSVNDDLRIPLPSGRRLSARLWLPDGAHGTPVPAVVEYAPFRHRDFTYPRDQVIHPWFAGHGYASLRLEPSGSQESDGLPMDEYVAQEQDDCVDALAWIAQQPWCSGQTGMFGMSWGAFSALQVAARRPPSLKAIIPVHGTDDRYRDDIHYKGGCLLASNIAWGTLYQTYMMRPPDPETAGDGWRDQWLDRMRGAPDILAAWLGHPNRDDYWRHGSIAEDYSRIEAATYIFCGWADGYTEAALRMLEHLACPKRLVIGPWGHTYPHIALPGPQIGFLQEAVRWWDRWLKGLDSGIGQDPPVRIYMQETEPPAPSYTDRAGRWLHSASWPLPETDTQVWFLNPGTLDPSAGTPCPVTVRSPLANGMTGWEWLPHGVGPEMPVDQRYEDAGSLCFDGPLLKDPIEICGTPVARLFVSCDRPTTTLLIRLIDVFPDGQATLLSYGLLDLSRRDDLAMPQPAKTGERYEIALDLNALAVRVPAGHHLRLSISTTAWPLVWPAPASATLTIETGSSRLDIQVRSTDADEGEARPFDDAVLPGPTGITWLRPVNRSRVVSHDLGSGTVTRTYRKDDGIYRVDEHGMQVETDATISYSAVGNDPLTARADYAYRIAFGRGDWSCELMTEITVTADSDWFHVSGFYRALENGAVVFERDAASRIARA